MSRPVLKTILSAVVVSLAVAAPSFGAEAPKIVEHNNLMDHGEGHLMDMEGGMVMGQNKDKLPAGCDKISEDVQIEVHAGRKFTQPYPGTMFGFDKHEWRIKPCTRLTVSFVNEDNIRHQWMMHGLPKFMYDKGMFHLEVTGPGKVTGTLILPSEDKTYLVHCDMAQHMEKGMKGQLIVGKGSGTFPTIPGITDPIIPDDYTKTQSTSATTATKPVIQAPKPVTDASSGGKAAAATAAPGDESTNWLIVGLLAGLFGTPLLFSQLEKRCKNKTWSEALNCGLHLFADALQAALRFLRRVLGKGKYLPGK